MPIYAYTMISTKGKSSTDGHSSYVINYVVQGNQVFQLLASLNRDGVDLVAPASLASPKILTDILFFSFLTTENTKCLLKLK